MQIAVRRTYLELRAPNELRVLPDEAPLPVEQLRPCTVTRYRELYSEVGAAYHWRDRLAWSDARLAAHLADPAVSIWTATVDRDTAGWFELHRHADASVEIAYFGLRPGFIGRGIGRRLLIAAATEAWRLTSERVWLHTCTLDAPAALPNYLARGFRVVKTEDYETELPNE